MDPLLKILIVIFAVLLSAGIIIVTVVTISELNSEVKARRKLLTWKWHRKKVQGDFLIKQLDFEEFVIYELKFSWRFGYYWQKRDYETDQERAERTLRRIIERKRRMAGLPRIYDFEGRLI